VLLAITRVFPVKVHDVVFTLMLLDAPPLHM